MMFRKPYILFFTFIGMLGFITVSCSNKNANLVTGSGTIEVTEYNVASKIPGRIGWLGVDEGDKVNNDEVIARLTTRELTAGENRAQASLKAANAQIVSAQAQLRYLATDLKRIEALYKKGGASKQQFDLIKSQTDSTKAQLNAAIAMKQEAKSALKLAEIQYDEGMLASPITGVVLTKNYERGDVIMPGSTIFTIGNLNRPWIKIYVSDIDLGRVWLGQHVHLSVDSFPNKTFDGTVEQIANKAEFTPHDVQTKEDRTALVFAVKVYINNSQMLLKPGMPADAVFETK
ncbi:MAG: efflux RND transporter periplasmic adaptor subunit [Deltaproteobacteria bacterium]|nr:efflux RND transporter periplasmic adaptor subunit [Deltaproteobacteria bacterium]MCL5792831.1 efflux RND transporter periplasmic adaptor subunit [Deltaproteobacteria bacterium]